jgi:hypothetical protein
VALVSTWAVDSDHVFAVGGAGTIALRHCNGWTALTSNTTQNLTGVWAASASDAWAVGDSGTVLHWDGTAWSAVTGAPNDNFTAVWGSGPNDIWIGATSAKVYHYNGTTWAAGAVGGVVLSVPGTSSTDVWAASESGKVWHFTGTWAQVDPAMGSTYYVVLARSTTNVWVTAQVVGKETMSWNGSTWTAHGTSAQFIQALWARSDTDIWGVSAKKVASWDGTTWTLAQPTTTNGSLWSVAGTATDLFVVGDNATILHRD